MIADINQHAVVGAQSVARFEFGHAVAAQNLPVCTTGNDVATYPRSRELTSRDRDDTATALGDVADIEWRADRDARFENEVELRRRQLRVTHGIFQRTICDRSRNS